MQKRIIYLLNDPNFFLSHRLNIALAAKSIGYDVYVVSPSDPGHEEIMTHGLNFIPWEVNHWGFAPLEEMGSITSLRSIYLKIRPDVVHHVTIKPIIYGTLVARLYRVPRIVNAVSGLGHVFTSHGIGASIRRFLVKQLNKKLWDCSNVRVIFQNKYDQSFCINHCLINPDQTTQIRGAGVSLTKYAVARLPTTSFHIIVCSRLLYAKGIAQFVEAARILHARNLSIRFSVYGDTVPNHPDAISQEQIDTWRTEGIVQFPGFTKDICTALKESHVVCLPTSYGEGIPRTLIEAAALGRAIITTRHPGCDEIVEDGVNGILVPVGDIKALAAAIELLATNPEKTYLMGKAGRLKVEKEGFAEETVVQQTLALYE